jgi:CubicO group peptidase (beta-lactamase class C family)
MQLPGSLANCFFSIILSLTMGVVNEVSAIEIHDPGNSVDSILNSWFLDGKFNGTVIISGDSGVIYNNSFGYSDLQSKKELNNKSIFCLASVSKVITSTAILKLYEEGKLDLDDLIPEYFPDLPDCYNMVSIAHLLTHTSGIPDFHTKPVWGVNNDDIYNFIKKQDILEFVPGSKYKYSNSGFVLLAMIIDKVSGITYPEYLDAKFFTPMGMKDTFVNKSRKKKRIVHSYHVSGKTDDRPNYFYGSGEIYTTAEDLLKWDKAFFKGDIISSNLMKRVLSQHRLDDGTLTNYGMGWGVITFAGQTIVGHTGGNYGFRTIYEHNLSTGLTFIMFTNIGDKCPTMEIRTEIMNAIGSNIF